MGQKVYWNGRRTEVVVPAEPSSVTSIDVHGDVGHVELLKSVRNTLTVAGSGVLAGLEVGVGDQVGKTVGLDNQSNGGVGVLLEDSNDGYILISMKVEVEKYGSTYGQCTQTCKR
jgi:hypothetical protein